MFYKVIGVVFGCAVWLVDDDVYMYNDKHFGNAWSATANRDKGTVRVSRVGLRINTTVFLPTWLRVT